MAKEVIQSERQGIETAEMHFICPVQRTRVDIEMKSSECVKTKRLKQKKEHGNAESNVILRTAAQRQSEHLNPKGRG